MSRRWKLAVAGLLVALLGGLFAWRYGGSTGGIDTASPEDRSLLRGWREIDGVAVPALARRLPGINGARDGLPAEGSYLVNFWATTCGPCKHEMPWLQRLATEDEVTVVGVTRDIRADRAENFLDERRISYANVHDQLGDLMAALRTVIPAALPSTILVEDGRVTWARSGPFDSYADLRESVAERLS